MVRRVFQFTCALLSLLTVFNRDQELRFTVHDSPDYYQLKLSVFHDDKKTDLIGESWIDLKDIVVPGGNQNDLWHNLSCRGKYAGEIRIELTYYDSRPKPEKAAPKPKPVDPEGPPKVKGPVKRRPLPTDPVAAATGVSPPQPAVDDLHPKEVVQPNTQPAPEPPRPQPKGPVAFIPTQSPLQNVEYGTPPPQRQQPPETHVPATQPPPPPLTSAYSAPPAVSAQHETPPRPPRRHTEQYSPSAHPFDDRGYSPKYPAQHHEYDVRSQYSSAPEPYQLPPIDDQRFQLPPDNERPPPPPVHRSRASSSHDLMLRGSYDATPQKGTPPMRHDVLRNEAHRNSFSSQSRPVYRGYDGASVSPHHTSGDVYNTPQSRHHSFDAAYDPHNPHLRQLQPTVEDVPESPTPARPRGHRTSDAHGRISHQPHETLYEENPTPAPLNLSGRGSMSSGHYSLPPLPSPQPSPMEQNGYVPAPSTVSAVSSDHQFAPDGPPPPPPAHNPANFDQGVESRALARRSPSMDYANGSREHPLSVSPGHGSGYYGHSTSPSVNYAHSYREHSGSVPTAPGDPYRERSPSFAPSELSGGHNSNANLESTDMGNPEDPSMMSTALVPRQAYHGQNQYDGGPHSEFANTQIARSDSRDLQQIPPSLVPGLDPALAREVSERIYEERRNERRQRTQSMATPPRGRDWTEAPPRDYVNGGSPITYAPPPQQYQQAYDARSSISYSNAGTPSAVRGVSRSPNVSPNPSPLPSPNPNHTIRRKSVSPAPIPSPNPSHTIRRKSVSPAPPPLEVPYGPDSYEALNPTFSTSQTDLALPDPDEKIITHDGKEIDPSDHLPMESWAPEPKPKDKTRSNSDEYERDRRYSSPRGAQPAPPPSGRRQLRIAGRPQSMAAPVTYHSDELPRTPPSAGRNRLQKKSNRMSALPSTASPAGSSPLAPISSHNYNADARGFTPPRPSRSSTWDYPSENHAPQYGSSPGGSMRGAPALPPKIPIPTMSGALVTTGGGSGVEDWALMEEMSRIDIGAGRSRRHGGY